MFSVFSSRPASISIYWTDWPTISLISQSWRNLSVIVIPGAAMNKILVQNIWSNAWNHEIWKMITWDWSFLLVLTNLIGTVSHLSIVLISFARYCRILILTKDLSPPDPVNSNSTYSASHFNFIRHIRYLRLALFCILASSFHYPLPTKLYPLLSNPPSRCSLHPIWLST